jgi:hypothetical protein
MHFKKNRIKAQSLQESSFHNQNTANNVIKGNLAPNAHRRRWFSEAYQVYLVVLWLVETGDHVTS